MKYTLAHVTHEAVDKLGGIGTVLEGLITSPIYKQNVGRSILVGPTSAQIEVDPQKRLGEHGKVLYSSVDLIDECHLAAKFQPIEWAFNVSIIYGTRTYNVPGTNLTGESEVILIDVFNTNADRLAVFKLRLAETFGIDSKEYEKAWDFEEYVRLAEPAFYALRAILKDEQLPCILFSHEFMGMATAFKAILDGPKHFKTIFHAHECATARYIVEHHPGHDTMFYNAMRKAREQGLYVEQVFGDLKHYFRHALISKAHVCDGVIAVGDDTAREMHFLGRHFDHHHIDLVYNGIPAEKVTLDEKNEARKHLANYAEKLIGYKPDILMTHVMRPVISKGVWRDVGVCEELEQRFKHTDQTAVLFILTTAGGTRRKQDIESMSDEYGWPRNHREGYPDLVGPEIDFHNMIENFNANNDRIQIVLVNQFGWGPDALGDAISHEMNMHTLRVAADVEFGPATYEPFGISPLEPLFSGAVCVYSNICGCAGFVNHVTNGEPVPNVIVADYTQLNHDLPLDQILNMTQQQRDEIEARVSVEVADELMRRIPTTDTARSELIESGQKLVAKMGWDQVIQNTLLPMLQRVVSGKPSNSKTQPNHTQTA